MAPRVTGQWAIAQFGFRSFDELLAEPRTKGPIFILGSGHSINDIKLEEALALERWPKFGINQVGHPSGARNDIQVDYWFSKDYIQQKDFCVHSDGRIIGIILLENVVKQLKNFERIGTVPPNCYLPWKYRGTHISSAAYRENGLLGNTTSVSPAMHAAMLMGFDPIVLLGVDLGWIKGADSTHCYPGRKWSIPSDQYSLPDGTFMTNGNYATMERELNISTRNMRRMGHTVINCSPLSCDRIRTPYRVLADLLADLETYREFDPRTGQPLEQAQG